jgi:hypothetical protein
MKRILFSIAAVFVVWSILDFVIHGLILQSTYEATARLWRPMTEMKMWLIYVAVLVNAVAFVCIYAGFFAEKNVRRGLIYGFLYGLGTGFSMGFGTYSFMPIPIFLAVVWFVGTLVEMMVGGIIVGSIIRNQPELTGA